MYSVPYQHQYSHDQDQEPVRRTPAGVHLETTEATGLRCPTSDEAGGLREAARHGPGAVAILTAAGNDHRSGGSWGNRGGGRGSGRRSRGRGSRSSSLD